MKLQRADCIAQRFQPPIRFRRFREVRPNIPPNPREAVWNHEPLFQLSDHIRISIGPDER